MTASAHVLVFRPLIEILRGRGDEVEITAREYAQTLQLLELHGLEAEVIGQHGGRSRTGKARALASRLRALRRWAKGRRFDVALAHGSHELTLTARRLGVPSSTRSTTSGRGCSTSSAAVPRRRSSCRTRSRRSDSRPTASTSAKLLQYPGLKEEYYLSDFEPSAAALEASGPRPGARARRAPASARRRALPPAREPVVPADARLPRPPGRRARDRDPAHRRAARFVQGLELPSVIVPSARSTRRA